MDMDDIGYRPPSLTVFIKNLLQRYTDGGQILKELLQNADDAGANTVKFAIDSRQHPRDPGGLWRDTLAPFQGPALLAWNNTKFSENDWKNVGKMQQSMKEEDVLKVGRFGLGFQSVHHITDLPTIVSGQHVAIFDPHEYLIGPDERNRQRTAKAFTVKEFCTYPAQIQPFEGVWGFSSCLEEYQGTLFRFPFRTKESNSEISDREYTPEEAEKVLFKSLAEEAERVLLFLNNVTTVELYRVSHVAFENKDQLLKVEMNPHEVQTARQWCRAMYSRYGNQPSVGSDSHVCRCTVKVSGPLAVKPGVTCWLLCSTIGAVDEKMKELAAKIKVVPAVGLATPIHAACNPQNHTFKDLVVKSCKEIEQAVKSSMSPHCAAVQWCDPSSALESNGFAYCFLPMSTTTTTGLPVHVHGYFSLSDNRRRVRWPDKDDQGDEATWNRLLMEKLIAPSYAILALARSCLISYRGCDLSVQSMKRNDDPYALLPLVSETKEESWKYLIQKVLRLISELPFLWIPIHGGQWVRNSEAYFTHDLMPNACPPDVVNLLLHLDCPIVHLPIKVQQDCHDLIPPIRVLTPQIARDFIRSNNAETVKLLQHNIELLSSVLKYVTQDGTQDLNNLPLIPVKESGTLVSFSCNSSSSIYSHSHDSSIDQVLFGLDNMLLSESLPGNIQTLFGKLGNTCQYQLRLANPDLVCSQLLKQSMESWCSPKGNVQWNIGQWNHPPRQWLSSVWKYVARNRKFTCVLDLPLVTSEGPENLPSSGRVNLYCLTQNSSLVRRNHDQFCSTEVQDIALALHFTIVADSRLYSDCGQELMHILPILSPDTLLNAMQSLSNTRKMVAKLSPTLKHSLRDVVTCIPNLSIQTINFLQSLPLYEVGVGNRTPTFQSASNQLQLLFPSKSITFPATFPFPSNILNVDSQEAETFYRITLRRQPLSHTALVKSSIFEFAKVQGTTVRNEILDWIVEESYGDQHLGTFVQTNRCIPNKSNQLCLVSELYDPHDSKLNEYFHQTEAAFPAAVRNRVLVQLQQLGLKNWKSVTVNLAALEAFLLDRAKSVATLAHTRGHPYAMQRSKLILQEVSNHDRCAELLQYLSGIPFLYCQQLPPSKYISVLKFAGSGHTQLFSLQQLYLQQHSVEYTAHLVGSVCLILSEQYNDCIMRMRMNRVNLPFAPVQTNHVLKHFSNLTALPNVKHASSAVPLLVERIYTFFHNSKRGIFSTWNGPLVWCSDSSRFVSKAKVAMAPLAPGLSLAPFRYSSKDLPFLETYEAMWLSSGVRRNFTVEDAVQVVSEVHSQYRGPLPDILLSLVVNIATFMQDSESLTTVDKMYLPSHRKTLAKPADLTYHDHYLELTGLESGEFLFVHSRVIPEVARFFKVMPLSSRAAPSEPLELEYECAGPYESITHRIKEAVEEYGEQLDVFKELIQNADDAGATEVKFLLDWRDFRKSDNSELLTKEMMTWQGPALYAYNNKIFSDEDLKNILKIAGQTKKLESKKIGRFGVGFCATYQLTDLPSFVTRRYLQFFDPHLTYLGERVKATKPGIQIDFVKQRQNLHRYFRSQIEPYQGVFGFDAFQTEGSGEFNGTLFRFPFRQQGVVSEICSDVFTRNSKAVQELKRSLIDSAKTLLLFLQHVNTVELFECDEKFRSGNLPSPNKLFSVSRTTISNQKYAKGFVTPSSLLNIKPHSELVKIVISKVDSPTKEESVYVVASSLGKRDSLTFACGEGMSTGLLPMAEVAQEITLKGKSIVIKECTQGQVCCFLPLPIVTNLSFHVSAYFDVSKDRKLLKGVQGSNAPHWNVMLMKDALLEAVLTLLIFLTEKIPHDNVEATSMFLKRYYTLFPINSFSKASAASDPVQSHLAEAFKSELSTVDQKLFWCELYGWLKPVDAIALSPEFSDSLGKSFCDWAYDILLELGVSVVKVPDSIGSCLKQLSVEMFCNDYFFQHVHQLSPSRRDKVLLYLLKHYFSLSRKYDWLHQLMSDSPCIPSKPNGVLCRPCLLVDESNNILKALFEVEERRFPTDKFSKHVSTLKYLGAAVDMLSDDDVIKRAKTVQILLEAGSQSKAIERSKNVTLYLVKHFSGSQVNTGHELLSELSTIPFLLPSDRPEGTTLCWNNNKVFVAAQHLYHPSHCHLVFTQHGVLDKLYHSEIQKILHFREYPSTDHSIVIQHLRSLIIWWCEVGKHTCTKEDLQLLTKTTSEIYIFLTPTASSVLSAKTDEDDKLYQPLVDLPFIWEGNCFYHAGSVFTDEAHVCPPYMVKLSRNKDFFRSVGVAERASVEQLVQMLQTMSNSKKGSILTEDEQDFCIHIARRLANANKQPDLHKSLYLPDNYGVMYHHADLMYMDNRDHTWLCTHDAFSDVPNKILNKGISWEVAECLGINNPVQTLLGHYSDNSFMSGLEYGQEENLCDRLANILRGYHQDTSIFKEFIQNADDAGATEISFVLDKRKFKDSSIFSEASAWKELQAMPSLLVFNNKKFTDNDIVGITRLGRGGKQGTPETIGRFGIGFNVAYHVTDCPMFVSHGKGGLPENFCVFDPTLSYAPGSTSKSPGRRWVFKKDSKDIASAFVDQLKPFSVETLNLLYKECQEAFAESPNDQKWANGFVTFRLPLTQDGPGKPFNKSHNVNTGSPGMTQSKLLSLMKQVVGELSQILLFLNSVRRISFFELSGSDRCNLLGSYCADLTPTDEAMSQTFNCSVLKQLECLKASKQPVCTVQSAYRVPVQGVRTVFDSVGLAKHTLSTSEEWVVSKRFGGEDLDQKLLHTGFQHSFLPLGGVAARLPTEEQEGNVRRPQGKLHCYLPLPLESGVPVHLNGHFWLNDSRRSLQHSKDSHLLKDWNAAVTNTIIAAAYAELLMYSRTIKTGEMEAFDLSWYYNLFPSGIKKGPLEDFNLPGSLYALLLSQNAPVLLAMRKYKKQQITDPTWLLLTNSTLPQQGLFFTEREGLNGEILLGLGMNLTAAPTKITCHMEKSLEKAYSGIVQPSMVRDHLRSLVPLNPDYLDIIQENVLPLLKFSISNIPDDVPEWAHFLHGVPLMLTEDGVLKEICCVYDGEYTNILPNCSAHFIHNSIWESDISSQLETMGIITKLTKSPEFASKNLCLPRNVGVLDFDGFKLKSTLVLFWKYLALVDKNKRYLFKSFSVVPTLDRKLYPYSHVNHILLEPPTKALVKLFNFPVVDFGAILPWSEEANMYSVFQSVFACETVAHILSLLENYLDVIVEMNIFPEEADVTDFVRFLEQDGDLDVHCNCKHLKCLPLFKLVSGHLKPIDSFITVHGIQNLPFDGLKELSFILQNVAFVIVPPYCENFMKNVGISIPSTWENKLLFYRDHLVPHFGKLPQADAPELLQPHIIMLLRLFQERGYFKKTKKIWDPIFFSLSTVPFVKGPQSSLCITALYDPELEVFEAFLDPKCFPPRPWTHGQTPGILNFFRCAGMIQAVDTDMWLRFARDFSKEIEQTSDHRVLLRKSQLLLSELCALLCSENRHFDNFYANASSIAFVPCKSIVSLQKSLKEALEICDPLFSLPSRKWTSLKGSVVVMKEGEETLVGLVKSCLDVGRDFNELFTSHLDKLGVSKVDALTVAKNLQCLSVYLLKCQEISTVKVKKNVSFLEEVFTNHYKFFNDSNVHSDDVSAILHRERCIFLPAENKCGFMLVAPSDICQDCGSHGDHLQPYIHSAPDCCSSLSHFLTIIGISKKLTIDQCLRVLTHLQYSTQPLNPNEWRTAVAAYNELVKLCRMLEKQDPEMAGNLPLAVVPLPTSCQKILPASKLVLDDASWSAQNRLQSNVVSYPLVHTPPRDDYSYCTLPTCLQVRLLSDVVTEHPHEQMLHEANVCNAESVARTENRDHGCNFVIALEINLRCPELQQGILRLFRHESQKVPTDALATSISLMLNAVDVKCVQMINTVLYNEQGSVIPGSEGGDSTCYVPSTLKDGRHFAYIAPHSNTANFQELMYKLCRGLLGRVIKDMFLVMQMLQCIRPEAMPLVLDTFSIPAYEHGTEGQPRESDLGQPVKHFSRLDYIVTCTFRVKEIVKFYSNGKWINAEIVDVPNVEDVNMIATLQIDCTDEVIQIQLCPLRIAKYVSPQQSLYLKKCWKLPGDSQDSQIAGSAEHQEQVAFLQLPIDNLQLLKDQLINMLQIVEAPDCEFVCVRLLHHLEFLCAKSGALPNFKRVAEILLSVMLSMNIDQKYVKDLLQELLNSRQKREHLGSVEWGSGGGGGGGGYSGDCHGDGGSSVHRGRHSARGSGGGLSNLVNPLWRSRGARRHQDPLWQPAPAVAEPPPQPNLVESKMWLTQSLNDFEAAKDQLDSSQRYRSNLQGRTGSIILQFPAQVCFLCHDSVEKCLKALFLALYGMSKVLTERTNLKDLCDELQSNPHWHKDPPIDLLPHVIQVSGHSWNCRYPNYNTPMMEPARVYEQRFEEAQDAVQAVERILSVIRQIATIQQLMREVEYSVIVAVQPQFDVNAFPPEWSPHDEGVRLREVPILEDSQEYNSIAELFHSSMGTRSFRIFNIVRIQNQDLWREFSNRRNLLLQQNKPVHDRQLFHGTAGNRPQDIYSSQRGLDIIRSNNGAYGRGIYLAKDAAVSHRYRHTDRGFSQMLVIKTLLGQVDARSRSGPTPTQEVRGGVMEIHDSIRGKLGGSDIFIVHRNDQTYPAYLITYK